MRKRSSRELPAIYGAQKTFSFRNFQPLSPVPLDIYDFTYLHFHDHLEIGYCISGCGICRVGDRQAPFQKGDVEIIFPYQQHLSRNTGTEQSLWYWMNIDLYSLLEYSMFSDMSKLEQMIFREMGLCGIFSPEEYPEITRLVGLLLNEMTGSGLCAATDISAPAKNVPPLYASELCACYVYQILICLTRLSAPLPRLEIRRDRRLLALSPALDLIFSGVSEGSAPSVERLAAACGMSVSNFRRVFQECIGLAPKEYMIRNLLYKAQNLLITTSKSVLEIGLETGFTDISGFNRQFLAKTGMTPSAFRKKYASLS